MSEIITQAFQDKWVKILSVITVILLFTGLFLPPLGIIDNSVLIAAGEIFGFASLFTLSKAIDRGIDAKLTHKDTSISINGQADRPDSPED